MTTPATELNPALETLCNDLADRAQAAARTLATLPGGARNDWLRRLAAALRAQAADLIEANARDLAAAPQFGLNAAAIDRLTLNPKRIESMAQTVEQVAALDDPIGEVVRSSRRPNGLQVQQIRVPIGVILFLYESRPNVTIDAAALCLKSGNAVILRGGKEAFHSNAALQSLISATLRDAQLPPDAVQLVPTTDRAAVGRLLQRPDRIDLVIPRGGEALIRRVVAEATMPVLKHYAGNCHVYIDASADPDVARRVVLNAKVQRPGVCNAAETLLIHQTIAPQILPPLAAALRAAGVELRGDPAARQIVPDMTPATDADWDTEYLDLILAVAIVDSLDQAIDHINRHGSRHTDAILTRCLSAARRFVEAVDSACVLVNASTRFNDGGELGLGAEIGISTDKFHARGPCGLRELTTTKWVVYGDGHIRT
ncbi:MAG: gamma-glutamyl phosphate reductase [Isosphaeraceae bacterium]|jgi:glutamate-5-semialdehyde dehydrogenase|nr:MAG: gamma-glutamyl phosphate reductase [Isosphaeraceae bacterium]